MGASKMIIEALSGQRQTAQQFQIAICAESPANV
jgi:hypothetical protein